MTAISIAALDNANLDVQHIEAVATSTALTATDRLGNVKSTVLGAVESLKAFNVRGAWATGTAYAVKDVFLNSGTWYITVTAHTASASFATDALNVRVYQGVLTRVSLLDKGAAGNGTTDDAAAITSAIASATDTGVVETSGLSYFTTAYNNPLGKPIVGGGAILMEAPTPGGGKLQVNSYGDDGKIFIGKENLYALYVRMRNGGPITGYFYGDSTVATGQPYVSAAFEPPALVKELLFRSKGFRRAINFTNRAVSGTGVGDINLVPDIDTVGGATTIMFIKSAINDGGLGASRLSILAANLDAKLGAARAVAGFGTVDNLAIVLVGPSATYDAVSGRASPWYEQVRNVYVAACRKWNCAYFDTYAYLRSISWAPTANYGLMMDDIGGGRGVHPKEILQNMIWSGVVDAMIGSDILPYLSGSWLPFTSALASTSGSGLAGTVSMVYMLDRDACKWKADVSISAIGASSGSVRLLLPKTPVGYMTATGVDSSSGKALTGRTGGGAFVVVNYYDNTYPGQTGAYLQLQGDLIY
jgi:hypothetical protein